MASLVPMLAAAVAPSIVGGLTGAVSNGAMQGLNMADEAFQLGMYGEQIRHQEQMSLESTEFDEAMDQKSENMREINTLRDVQMAQRKADDTITKKFIQSISE